MNDLPRQKLKEIIIQHGRSLCDNPQRCEAFLRDYCGGYRREIFILISALKQDAAKDLLNSNNVPLELLVSRLIKKMQNELGLTEEAAHYAVESWAQALDKMPQQQIQQPRFDVINKANKKLNHPVSSQQTTVVSPLFTTNQQQQKLVLGRGLLKKAGVSVGLFILVVIVQQIFTANSTEPEINGYPTTEITELPTPEITRSSTPKVTRSLRRKITEPTEPEITEPTEPEITEPTEPEITESTEVEVDESSKPENAEFLEREIREVNESPTPEVTESPTLEVTESPTLEVTESPTPEKTNPI
ncbi:hypothetical protein CEP14_09665 [Cylindrospermopsis raciborskii C04]|uniref:Uncharacterized protein n=1 Tax=Cylindrospermopsis raciborskii C07 TaxID=2014886 RepID=A0ABX4WJU4_9CYAN|nr:hypothetical protein [Cylindrospermopsis raciborskii]PNJ93263.1 hypothetical protein CEP13_12885 [Cylindrospermopsis raciborskii C03]PNJ94917.1 hypothetical protein CEP15_12365 [Cylindrospermopsis raciborskii C07]PNJ95105.1 hypothetical protein CEP14_09665 [Cylindrospermopsis raciborskii C04]